MKYAFEKLVAVVGAAQFFKDTVHPVARVLPLTDAFEE